MEFPIHSLTCLDELGQPRSYHYFLLVDQISAGPFTCENYGVQIREENGSCVSIPNLTTSATRINTLLSLLIRHAVSPTTLPDVVTDWI